MNGFKGHQKGNLFKEETKIIWKQSEWNDVHLTLGDSFHIIK